MYLTKLAMLLQQCTVASQRYEKNIESTMINSMNVKVKVSVKALFDSTHRAKASRTLIILFDKALLTVFYANRKLLLRKNVVLRMWE